MTYVNPVRIIVLLTFIHFLFRFDRSKKIHVLLLLILFASLGNETLTIILKYCGISIKFNNSIYSIVHTTLWLRLLGLITLKRKTTIAAILFFLMFALCNFLWIDGWHSFNAYTMILGAFLYVGLYIADCYKRLESEDLAYFSSGNYILTSSPLLFFIGFSILLGFRNKSLQDTDFFGMTLYKIVGYSINFVYYFLLNTYIYGERKKT